MRERSIRVIRGLLWLSVVCLGLPTMLRFVLYAAWIMANGLDGAGLALCLAAAVDLLPMGVCAAISATTLLRLMGRELPVWWWSVMAALTGLCACPLILTDVPADQALTVLPVVTSAVLVTLNGLWSLAHRTLQRKER